MIFYHGNRKVGNGVPEQSTIWPLSLRKRTSSKKLNEEPSELCFYNARSFIGAFYKTDYFLGPSHICDNAIPTVASIDLEYLKNSLW